MPVRAQEDRQTPGRVVSKEAVFLRAEKWT
jgi:hypothetical protein